MSSSMDAGYYADQAVKVKKTKCKKSPTGKHKWVRHGVGPSAWDECKYCKVTAYWK